MEKNNIIPILLLLILLPMISAETTFFEGREFVHWDSLEEEQDEIDRTGRGDSGSLCYPFWECTSWKLCDGTIQERRCEIMNGCILTVNKPTEARYCSISKFYDYITRPIQNYKLKNEEIEKCPVCLKPTTFNECSMGSKSRISYTCSELTDFKCQKYTNRKSCIDETDEPIISRMFIWSIIAILIIIIFFLYLKRKKK